MKASILRKTVFVLLAALLAFVDSEETQTETAAADPARLQEELENVLRQIRELREGYYAHKQAQEERIQALSEQTGALRAEQEALKTEEASLRRSVQELASESVDTGGKRERYGLLLKETPGLLKPFVERQRAAVQSGLPYRLDERLAPLRRLEAELAAQKPRLSALIETVWLFVEGELREAAEGSAYTGEIDLPGGRKKPARFCHVGNVFLGFMTEDGQERGFAVLPREPGGACRWELGGSDRTMLEIRDSVWILDRKAPPRLLLLPVTIRTGGIENGAK
jgi:hypothetical protein